MQFYKPKKRVSFKIDYIKNIDTMNIKSKDIKGKIYSN